MGADAHARFSCNFYTVAADQCKLQRQSINRTAKNRAENKTGVVEELCCMRMSYKSKDRVFFTGELQNAQQPKNRQRQHEIDDFCQ